MEKQSSRALSGEKGAALVIVLVAIVVLLPLTLVLSTLALRWQRGSLDYRDTLAQEFAAHAGFEEARNRIAGRELGLAVGEVGSFAVGELEGSRVEVRVIRSEDVVLTLDGRVLKGLRAGNVDLEQTGTDPEGRVVYRFRKLEIYVIEADVHRRPSLPGVKLEGVVARLPDGSLQTLGVTVRRLGSRL